VIDKEVIDEIERLTADQLLMELREAKESGSKLDPRTLKAAMELIEKSMGKQKAFAPAEPRVTPVRRRVVPAPAAPNDERVPAEEAIATEEEPDVLPAAFNTKAKRDKLRLVPYLTADERQILDSHAEMDGAEELRKGQPDA